MPNVLIVYGTSHGQTRKIARRIEEHLVARGIAVEAHDVRNLSRTFQVSQYDGVIVGGRIWMSKVPKNLREFVIFAGALPYTRYHFFLRWVMKRIATMAGRDTDTSRDYEYTDWDEVARFAEEFADQVQPRARVQPETRAAAVSPL